jgi:hypothetical protein
MLYKKLETDGGKLTKEWKLQQENLSKVKYFDNPLDAYFLKIRPAQNILPYQRKQRQLNLQSQKQNLIQILSLPKLPSTKQKRNKQKKKLSKENQNTDRL